MPEPAAHLPIHIPASTAVRARGSAPASPPPPRWSSEMAHQSRLSLHRWFYLSTLSHIQPLPCPQEVGVVLEGPPGPFLPHPPVSTGVTPSEALWLREAETWHAAPSAPIHLDAGPALSLGLLLCDPRSMRGCRANVRICCCVCIRTVAIATTLLQPCTWWPRLPSGQGSPEGPGTFLTDLPAPTVSRVRLLHRKLMALSCHGILGAPGQPS